MNLFNLFAKISLNNEEFEKGVKEAEKSGKSLTSQVKDLAKKYKAEGMTMSDAMKKAHKEIEKQAKDAYIAANGSLKGYVSELKKETDELAKKRFPQVGSSLDKNVTKALKWAGAGLVTFGGLAINTASDLQEVENVTTTVFGNMNDDIEAWSKGAISKFGLTELQAKQYTGTLGALITSSGIGGEAMKNMAIDLTGLAADFASFYNLDHDEAFEKIKSGISGETEPLKALGINMSVANMEAYALTQGINKSWNEMSQAEQTTLRYKYIMEKGALASGDFAKTLDESLSNQLRVAKNEFMAMAAEVGQKFIPMALELVKWVRENKDAILMFGSAALSALVALKGFTIINTLIGLWKSYKAGTLAATLAQKGFNVALLTNPIAWAVAGIGALVGGVIYLWKTNENFRNAIIKIWGNIKEGIGIAVDGVVSFFNETIPNAINNVKEWFAQIPKFFEEVLQSVVDKFSEWGENIGNFFTETIPQWIENIGNWFAELPYRIGYALGETIATVYKWGTDTRNYFVENVPKWIESIDNWFAELPDRIKQWLMNALENIKNWGINVYNKAHETGKQFIDGIVTWFKELPGRIQDWLSRTIARIIAFKEDMKRKADEAAKEFGTNLVEGVKELPEKFKNIGKDIARGVWEGIKSMGRWLRDNVKSFFSGMVDGAKDALGIHSPSRVFRDEVGIYAAQGVGVGFVEEMDNVNKDIQDSINTNINLEPIKKESTTVSGMGEITDLLLQILNKDTILEVEGREIARAISPYQEELEEYNTRNTVFA